MILTFHLATVDIVPVRDKRNAIFDVPINNFEIIVFFNLLNTPHIRVPLLAIVQIHENVAQHRRRVLDLAKHLPLVVSGRRVQPGVDADLVGIDEQFPVVGLGLQANRTKSITLKLELTLPFLSSAIG